MTQRERRVVVLGGTVIALLVAVRLTGAARAELAGRTEALDQARELVARAEALAADAPALPETLAVRNADLVRRTPWLLEGRSVAEAVANLSALVNGWAALHGVEVTRVVPREDVTANPLASIELLVRGRGDLEGLVGLLAAIEAGPALLVIDRLTLDREPTGGSTQSLNIEFIVRGFALVREDA